MLTALPVEYDAVRRHLHDRVRVSHPRGIEFEVGTLSVPDGQVAIAELGQGNIDAAMAVVHAVDMFRPSAILFVGIAGALHDDLQIGDVIAAVKVYAYQGGTVSDYGTHARPRSHDADWELEQRARVVARDHRERTNAPAIHFRPVAAGDVVLNSRTQPLADQLKNNYNDAGAVEMESAGMVRACHVCKVPALVIRGISDRADGAKEIVDAAGSQPLAAGNAADFAVAVISDYLSAPHRRATKDSEQPPSPTPRSKAAHTEAKASTQAPASPVSVEHQNAVRAAQSYLQFLPFSRKGLIRQLSSSDGYPQDVATLAVDSLDIDYNEQAARSAQNYLENVAFSRKGLIDQLESNAVGFSHEQATHGVNAAGL